MMNKRRVLLLTFCSTAWACVHSSTPVDSHGGRSSPSVSTGASLDANQVAQIDALLGRLAEVGDAQLSVAVVRPGGIVYRHYNGVGDRPAHNVAGLGSIMKPVLAIAIARLVSSGDLSLEERVVWGGVSPNDAPTVEELLSHRAGLPNFPEGTEWPSGTIGGERLDERHLAEAYRRARGALRTPPAYQYSTLGYAVLGLWLEARLDEELTVFLRRLVFAPLGMERIGLAPVTDGEVLHPPSMPEVLRASANLRGSIDGLAFFARFLLGGASDTSLQDARALVLEQRWDAGPSWSVGRGLLGIRGTSIRWHQGVSDETVSFLVVDPSAEVGVAVLHASNGSHSSEIMPLSILLLRAVRGDFPFPPTAIDATDGVSFDAFTESEIEERFWTMRPEQFEACSGNLCCGQPENQSLWFRQPLPRCGQLRIRVLAPSGDVKINLSPNFGLSESVAGARFILGGWSNTRSVLAHGAEVGRGVLAQRVGGAPTDRPVEIGIQYCGAHYRMQVDGETWLETQHGPREDPLFLGLSGWRSPFRVQRIEIREVSPADGSQP